MNKNKRVMKFESRKGSKRKKKKDALCKLESIFFFLLFFHYSLSFALQRSFLELDVALP
jgi:hypothetical protein